MAEEQEKNIFDEMNAQIIPGLEHLGRAIIDANGAPSGSPANWEHLRGVTGQKPIDVQVEVEKLLVDPALQVP